MNSPTLTGILSEIRMHSHNDQYRQALKEAIDIIAPRAETALTVLELEDKYTGGAGWGEHPDWPRQDWRQEVASEDTQVGYWEWVFNKVQSEDES